MTLSQEQLSERLHQFTDSTLTWCSKESEQATARVTNAIELLLKNTKRVSSISQESLDAIQGLRNAISNHFGEDKAKKVPVGQLIKSLEVLASGHNEIDAVIHPIISSLQFQDRMRQNFENMVRMLPLWLATRERAGTAVSGEELERFAGELCKVTTMMAERDIIREVFPGAPEEVPVAPVLMF